MHTFVTLTDKQRTNHAEKVDRWTETLIRQARNDDDPETQANARLLLDNRGISCGCRTSGKRPLPIFVASPVSALLANRSGALPSHRPRRGHEPSRHRGMRWRRAHARLADHARASRLILRASIKVKRSSWLKLRLQGPHQLSMLPERRHSYLHRMFSTEDTFAWNVNLRNAATAAGVLGIPSRASLRTLMCVRGQLSSPSRRAARAMAACPPLGRRVHEHRMITLRRS